MNLRFWSNRQGRTRTRLVTHPRQTLVLAVVAALAAAGIVGAAVAGARTIANAKTGEIFTEQTSVSGDVVSVLPDTPGALLVQRDDEGAVVGLTAFALNPGGHGGTVIVIPTSTVIPLPDGSVRRVGDAYNDGGVVAQRQAVEALLGVSFSASADVDQAGLAALLAPYAPMTVTFTDRVVDTIDGDDEQLYEAGNPDLTADDAARVLLARKDGESELARIDRTVAVWDAVLGDAPPATETTAAAAAPTTAIAPDATVDAFLAGVAGGPHGVQDLEVTVRPDVEGNELFDVRSPEYVHLLMAQVMPGAVSTADGARVRLLQPRPDQDGLLVATARLDVLGMHLVLATSGGDEAMPERTRVEYYEPGGKAAADQIAQSGAFGPSVEVVASEERIEEVDLTITLGADFEEIVQAAKAEAEAAGSTTTVGPPVTEQSENEDEEDG